MRDEKLEKIVTELYDSELPYHNFDHIRRVTKVGQEIVDRCVEEDIPIDETVVYYALLFHDAGYRDDHTSKGFDSKEAYSASLAEEYLKEYGVGGSTIEAVKQAILCTIRDATFDTNEQKAVRAADLFDMGADYETFKANSDKLYDEQELLYGRGLTRQQWLDETEKVIGYYLKQEIRLTSYFYDELGRSIFHTHVRANLDRYLGKV